MSYQHHRRGFTLIELMVALFITAIIFLLGYGAINQALNNHELLKARQNRLTEVETAMRVLVQDFSQLTPRPVRDILGGSLLPCLVGGSSGTLLGSDSTSLSGSSSLSLGSTSLSSATSGTSSTGSTNSNSSTTPDLVAFTRAGWANPAGIQRPALERVSYRLENGTLERMHYPVLDATEASVPVRRDLLTHVKSVTFRFLTDARQWTNQWPPLGPNLGTLRLRPFAVEVTVELEDWGRIVRIIEVAT